MILVGGDAARAEDSRPRPGWRCDSGRGCSARPSRPGWSAVRGFRPSDGSPASGEAAVEQLRGARRLILAGAASPVTFFGYPGKPSDLVPEGCEVSTLSGPVGAAAALAAGRRIGRRYRRAHFGRRVLTGHDRPDLGGGDRRDASGSGHRGGRVQHIRLAAAPVHRRCPCTRLADVDWRRDRLRAAGRPGDRDRRADRRCRHLESDGSAMYTISALWSHARRTSTSPPWCTRTGPTTSCVSNFQRRGRRARCGAGT